MALQPLDKVIFVVGLFGQFGFIANLFLLNITVQRELNAPVQTPRPDAELKLTCWTPDHFTAAANQFAHNSCTSKFLSVIQGHVSAENSGLYDADSGEVVTFEAAKALYEDEPAQPHPMESPEAQKEQRRSEARIFTMIIVMSVLIWIAFILAIMFGQVGSANACYLEAAFWRVLMGEGSSDSKVGTEHNGGLLDKPSNAVVTKRIITLTSTRKLAVGYLVFQVLFLLGWCVLGFVIHHDNVALRTKVDQVVQTNLDFKVKMESLQKKMTAMQAAATNSTSPSGQEGAVNPTQTQGLTPEEQALIAQMAPPPTHDSANFICDFLTRTLGNEHRFSVQCVYDVHRQAPAKTMPFDPTKILQSMANVLKLGEMHCFGMAVVYLLYTLFFFLAAPMSLRLSLLPVLKQLGARPRGGVQFGLTDVYFVAAYAMLARKDKFLLSAHGNSASLEMQHLGKNLDEDKDV